MIIDPDFPDHWKTRMLVGLLDGDEASGMYVIRLWGHCQMRRQWRFANLSPEALKALCRFPGHANKLDASLSTSGFIRREAGDLVVCGWDDYNASLIAAWANGARGGRPQKPTGSMPETHSEPTGSRLDGIGEEKKGKEKTPLPPLPFLSDSFKAAWSEWEQHRKEKGIKITPTALARQFKKLAAMGEQRAIAAIEHSVANSYQGIYEPNGSATVPKSEAKKAEFDRVFDEFGKKGQS